MELKDNLILLQKKKLLRDLYILRFWYPQTNLVDRGKTLFLKSNDILKGHL